MTTEIEKTFFDTFGIKAKYIYYIKDTSIKLCYYSATKKHILDYFTNKNNRKYKVFNVKIEHPQITDSILLELILINMHNEDLFGYPTNIQELKDNTLKQLIETYNKFSTCVTCDGEYQQSARDIKRQVRTLFEEG